MEQNRKRFWLGVAWTLLGGMLWGFSGTSVQYLTTTGGVSPTLLTFTRIFLGGVIFLAFLLLTQRSVLARMFGSARSVALMLLFALSLYGNQICYAQTVQITNAGTATVLQMLGSVFVMVFVCVQGRHLPRAREFAGLVIAIAATVMIATQGDVRSINIPLDGLVWGILTGLTTAAYILIPKHYGLLDQFGSIAVVGMGMLLGTVFGVPVYLLEGNTLTDAWSAFAAFGGYEWMIFLLGLVAAGTMGGYGFYLHGVSIVGSVKGSLLGAIEPVSATALAAAWLGTVFTGWDIAGMILMCVMVVFITSDEPTRDESLDANV